VHILVVDDEEPIVQLCLQLLGRLGHTVVGATSGEEALAKLVATPVDLIVVDYRMPGLDGFQVLRRARELHPRIRIVLTTGQGTNEVVGAALDDGVHGIIVKPFTPDELTKVVSAVL
jgi:two-component system response regulator AtoC